MIEGGAPCPGSAGARIARAWLDAMNAHDVPALRVLLAEDFLWLDAAPFLAGPKWSRFRGGDASASAAVDLWEQWFAAMPGLALRVVRELDGQDWAIRQLRIRGMRAGKSEAAPPTVALDADTFVDEPGCAILTLRAERITQLWLYRNALRVRTPALGRPHADF